MVKNRDSSLFVFHFSLKSVSAFFTFLPFYFFTFKMSFQKKPHKVQKPYGA